MLAEVGKKLHTRRRQLQRDDSKAEVFAPRYGYLSAARMILASPIPDSNPRLVPQEDEIINRPMSGI